MEYRKGGKSLLFYGAGYYTKELMTNFSAISTGGFFLTSSKTAIFNLNELLVFELFKPAPLIDGFTDAITGYSENYSVYGYRFNIRCVRTAN